MLAAIEFYWLLTRVIEKNTQQRPHLYLKNIANILAFYEFFFWRKMFFDYSQVRSFKRGK